MDKTTGKEQIFRLLPKYDMEHALRTAWDKKVSIFSKGLVSLISRPKPEEIKITDQNYLYEPFWHIKCNVHYEYDRTRDYNFSILDPEVKSVTIDGKDYSVATTSRQFTIMGIEHCITEGSKEVIFDAVSRQEKHDWEKYLLFEKESVNDVPEVSTDGSTYVSPEMLPKAAVQQVFSSLPQPIRPDTTPEEKKDVSIVNLYFRPVYVFEYKWERNGKTAVAEFDGLTGEMTFVGDITLRQKIEKVMTRDLFFDISTEAANLVIPGSGIAVRVIKEVAKK
ncbi:hypothetical protein FXW07_06635 [Methanosarcina sp. DH1]|uniref:hypothetical protein n=1 Tax=Methanosarcina sp. DH1 TaxID=2605695 RepID=UPI001E4A06FC|nr:hypothetical protein [Methanosarcina sp. DH1]MCC4766299.1 hypothetical protein [Methanosarcina sp. DH1]